MRVFLAALVAGVLGGCAFGQGFRDESLKQLAEMGASIVEDKLDERFKDVSDAISGLPAKLPAPTPPPDRNGDALLYSLGALAAYVVGSLGKGYIRQRIGTPRSPGAV